MGINSSDTSRLLAGNRTGGEELSGQDDLAHWLLVLKIFSFSAASLVVVILITSAAICGTTFHKRNRQYRRAREYENMVKHSHSTSPVHITGTRRMRSIHKSLVLMRKRDSSAHNAQVYFIYNNPALYTEEHEAQEEGLEESSNSQPCDNHSLPSDSSTTGIILNPCVFFV